jgi:hypothetical protein
MPMIKNGMHIKLIKKGFFATSRCMITKISGTIPAIRGRNAHNHCSIVVDTL